MIVMQPSAGLNSANGSVDTALTNCMFATCAALHGGPQVDLHSLTFNHNAILDVPFIANWMSADSSWLIPNSLPLTANNLTTIAAWTILFSSLLTSQTNCNPVRMVVPITLILTMQMELQGVHPTCQGSLVFLT